MAFYQPKPPKPKVRWQLAVPCIPEVIDDALAGQPIPGFKRLRRDFRCLTPPEIHAIGKRIYRSVSTAENLEEAVFYFNVAADMDYPPSQNMYAFCLDQSLNPGTASYGYFSTLDLGPSEFKRKEMISNYKRAAQAGHKRALNNLGVCYIQGNGVNVDVEKGMNLLFQSKQAGDKLGSKNYAAFTENHNIPHKQLTFAFGGRIGARG
jgi:TPR repeat protein